MQPPSPTRDYATVKECAVARVHGFHYDLNGLKGSKMPSLYNKLDVCILKVKESD